MIVADNGEGIPEELEERLFQRFLHQGDMPLVLGSVGLGLSIVQALAEGMGGAVWYERDAGWTKFVVRVPLSKTKTESRFREADLTRKRGHLGGSRRRGGTSPDSRRGTGCRPRCCSCDWTRGRLSAAGAWHGPRRRRATAPHGVRAQGVSRAFPRFDRSFR